MISLKYKRRWYEVEQQSFYALWISLPERKKAANAMMMATYIAETL